MTNNRVIDTILAHLKNMRKTNTAFFAFVLATSLLFSNPKQLFASGGCVPVYGGGVQCPKPGELLIDKKVRNPATGVFVDNLGPTDPKYRPNPSQNIVTFQITVRNSGEEPLRDITVTDTLPLYVEFMSGPATPDANRTFTFRIDEIAGGSSKTYEVRVRVAHQSLLPEGRNLICPIKGDEQPVNIVTAMVGDRKETDSSQFCIEKELQVKEVPSAGPVEWVASFVGFSTLLAVGAYLRKKAIVG